MSSPSAASTMLFLLKTRDLTTQDHSINIEVMLAPSKTFLLLKKHKTLNARCNQDKTQFERQLDTAVNSFRSEITVINRQKQDLYVKRVLRLLESMTDDEKKKVLSRRSYSSSLNKIQEVQIPEFTNQANIIKEISPVEKKESKKNVEKNSSMIDLSETSADHRRNSIMVQPSLSPRLSISAPNSMEVGPTRRNSYSPTNDPYYCDMDMNKRRASLMRHNPKGLLRKKSIISPVTMIPEIEPGNETITPRDRKCSITASGSHNGTKRYKKNQRRESHGTLPVISYPKSDAYNKNDTHMNKLPVVLQTIPLITVEEVDKNEDTDSCLLPAVVKPSETAIEIQETADSIISIMPKSIRFCEKKPDSAKYRWHSAQFKEQNKIKNLNTKINKFIGDQAAFNRNRLVMECSDVPNSTFSPKDQQQEKRVQKEQLVNIFDNFCETRNTAQLQKLLKLASKMKTQSGTINMQTTMQSAKTSHTFQRLQSNA